MEDPTSSSLIVPAFSRIADIALLIINVFNVFVLFAHLHPVESPLKKPLIRCVHRVVADVHSLPFVVSTTLAALIAIAAWSAVHSYRYSSTAMLIRAIVAAYTFACSSIFVKLSDHMLKLSIDRVLDIERECARQDMLQFQPPSLSVMNAVVAPTRPFFRVESVGLDRIPSNTPHLFVSNHSLYGMEMPSFIHHLYEQRGIFPRGLADHFHFATPNGRILRAFGAVDGTRENVDALMQNGSDILVYPGGGHEVLKHSSVPRYELMWKQRLGFARCAIKHGYSILPCACVGAEDMWDTVADLPMGYRGMTIPIAITTPGKVQKVYFWFGHPISTSQYNGDFNNDDFAREVRNKTKVAIEKGIQELQERQSNDPARYLKDRYVTKFRQYFSASSSKDKLEDSGNVCVGDTSHYNQRTSAAELERKEKLKDL